MELFFALAIRAKEPEGYIQESSSGVLPRRKDHRSPTKTKLLVVALENNFPAQDHKSIAGRVA
jgi:hypothetical protein